MDRFWSAGEEDDNAIVSILEPAVRAGEGIRSCNGIELFPKDADGPGNWLDIAWPDGQLWLRMGSREKTFFVASVGVFPELGLGLGVTEKGEVGVFSETSDWVLIWNEDGGE